VESGFFFTSRTSPASGRSAPPYDQNNLATHVGDDLHCVVANRAALAGALALKKEQLFFMNQVHGSTIIEIDSTSDSDAIHECDGLITKTPGVGLAVLVADCAPVLFIGATTVAAIHVGWRGLFDGIVEKALALMAHEPFALHIGATICGNCYEVADELAERAHARGFVVGRSTLASDNHSERSTLDIPQSILGIVKKQSVVEVLNAEWNGICTYENQDYYSFRRERITGRQAGVVVHGS
jgi:YfiH family protein